MLFRVGVYPKGPGDGMNMLIRFGNTCVCLIFVLQREDVLPYKDGTFMAGVKSNAFVTMKAGRS